MHYILEWREEHTVVANTHVEDLCVGGVFVLLNDMEKLTLLNADLTVLTAFAGNGLWQKFVRHDLRTHALH